MSPIDPPIDPVERSPLAKQTLAVGLVEACAKYGDATALAGVDTRLGFADLSDAAHRIAASLAAEGSRPHEPIHVLVSNHPHDVVALLGVWLAGGVAVPVHRTTPAAVAARFLAKTRARFLLTGGPHATITRVDSAEPPSRPLLEGGALIVFTSGSTGEPKGVVVGHDAFHGKILQIDEQLQYQPNERTLLVLNITFSFGLWLSLLTLLRGGTLVMREKFEPASFTTVLLDERITRVGMVPTMMRVLFSQPRVGADIDRVVAQGDLAQIVIGGESLGRSLADTIRARFTSTELVDIYGLTETATCDFFAFPADYARRPGCIGRPAPGIEYRLVDADDRPVTEGEIGELQIASPFAMRGYLDAPDLTAAAFDGGWFRTGDLARGVAGMVELMGRRKEVISRGGNKVTPVEIEQCLCLHPDVAGAMAVGIDDAVLGERIHVLLVPRADATLDVDSVKQSLVDRLERYKHPDRYYVAAALPTGRTGKADRSQLRALILDGAFAPVASSERGTA